jgi:hypothetical protein
VENVVFLTHVEVAAIKIRAYEVACVWATIMLPYVA